MKYKKEMLVRDTSDGEIVQLLKFKGRGISKDSGVWLCKIIKPGIDFYSKYSKKSDVEDRYICYPLWKPINKIERILYGANKVR